MIPGVVYFLVFHYGVLFGNIIAFKDYVPFDGFFGSAWVGVSNFTSMFGDPAFWHAALNTIEIAVLQLVFYFPAPLGLALLLHSLTSTTIRRVVQSVVYLPHFMSWVIVVALAQQMLGDTGVLNSALSGSGLHTVDIIGNPTLFKPLTVLEVIWKDCGWGTIIFLASLTQVDEQLYEASAIDGAGPWRRFWHVTLPAIRPIIILLLIMRIGDILSVGFEQILLQRNSVGPQAAEIIDTFVYYKGLIAGNFGLGAAAGLVKGVIGAILVFSANRVSHRLGEQGVYS
ncbi:polysaccharide ABC transporter ATP-binding protein [Mangrovactinospora gilvigrisea]|uniref:Polysaccharide ABC transporter ATP-binding protein n=1 Tax=Mangrovactinospora gilvigrisea TaxID=1428644 RepID=A0A1J7BI89_9ACTN|nr:ABC transporter permease subunit [Mangrovactinospora gilvigrisea]OIV38379.1 polysaccharide ABC transporter ATP-binding protein [Mangrovactinospora gilvigrisea]